MSSPPSAPSSKAHGGAVVRAAFVVALFGWGVGFDGRPVFVHAVLLRSGWPLSPVSVAVTVHFLFGAGVVACLPRIHRHVGIPASTIGGAVLLAAGVLGWASAVDPWLLFVAAMLTGGGWVPLGAAGINAMVATRELAWAPLGEGNSIDRLAQANGSPATSAFPPALWMERRFLTLAAAMALGLFAQIGLIAQLFSLMAPTTGVRLAGGIMALATGCGMAGRLAIARLLGARADRRLAGAASDAVQALGTLILWAAGPEHLGFFILGTVLFGLAIGNATSLPPLIAHAEFAPTDVARVVARGVALSQLLYACAPPVLARLILGGSAAESSFSCATGVFFAVIFSLQALAATCLALSLAP